MTDTNDDIENTLDQILNEKPQLEKTIEGLSNDHLERVMQVGMAEYNKRVDPLKGVATMNDAEFAELRRRYGV